jgi:hypothetical protein
MKRRSFGKFLVAAGTTAMVKKTIANPLKKLQSEINLPAPFTGSHSVEICHNSRVSTHGGYSGNLDKQILANALWAASKAPLICNSRKIYAALCEGVYLYDQENNSLILHLEENHLSESNLAFETGVITDPIDVA